MLSREGRSRRAGARAGAWRKTIWADAGGQPRRMGRGSEIQRCPELCGFPARLSSPRADYFGGAGAGMVTKARAPSAIHLPSTLRAIQVTWCLKVGAAAPAASFM